MFGAQMAAIEGERMVNAMLDINASPEEKSEVLDTYMESVQSRYQKARTMATLSSKDGGWTPAEKKDYMWAIGVPEGSEDSAVAKRTINRLFKKGKIYEVGGKKTQSADDDLINKWLR